MPAPGVPGGGGWIDLSRPLSTGMPVVPGDPEVRIGPALTLDRDGVGVSRLALGSHSGSHVDAPAHLVAGGRTVDRLGLDELCGPALVVGLAPGPGGGGAAAPVTAERLRPLLEGRDLPPRVLLHTGTTAAASDPIYPHLGADAARWLWDRGVRLLGVDTPSPDPPPTDRPGDGTGAGSVGDSEAAGLPVHRIFLGGDGILVESLTGLDAFAPAIPSGGPAADWTAGITVGIHPLPLRGVDGAPARVVGRAGD